MQGEPFSQNGKRLLYAADQASLKEIDAYQMLAVSSLNHYHDDKLKEMIVRQKCETNLKGAIAIAEQEEKIRAKIATNKKVERIAGIRTGTPQSWNRGARNRGNNQKPRQCYKCGSHHQQPFKVQKPKLHHMQSQRISRS